MADIFHGVNGHPVAMFQFENGWTVQVEYIEKNCSSYIEVPTHIHNGGIAGLREYLETWIADPLHRDKAHNTDTELALALASVAGRKPIGPAGKLADKVAAMIKQAGRK